MLINFPYMHSEFVSLSHVDGTLFFDPGLEDIPLENGFRPDSLPVDPKMARRVLQDCISYGEQFASPGDMVAQAMHESVQTRQETESEIRQELVKRMSGNTPDLEDKDKTLVRAQFFLILAFTLEDRQIDSRRLEEKVRGSWDRFDQSMGFGTDEDSDDESLDMSRTMANLTAPSGGEQILPWKLVLESMTPFLPEGAVLICSEPDVAAALKDAGFESSTASNLPDGLRLIQAPAWKLSGRRKMPEDRPELAAEIRMAVPA